MDFPSLRLCRKSETEGGLSKPDIMILAKKLGMSDAEIKLVSVHKSKNLLCDALFQHLLEQKDFSIMPSEISQVLIQASDYWTKHKDPYRASGLLTAGQKIGGLKDPITDPITQLLAVGITYRIIDRVIEYILTGTLTEFSAKSPGRTLKSPEKTSLKSPDRTSPKNLDKKDGKAVAEGTYEDSSNAAIKAELTSLQNFGPAIAKELIKRGVTGIDDLVKKYDNGDVSLTHAQQIGLKYHLHFRERVPRAEVKRIGDIILSTGKKLSPAFRGEIVGSYRRGQPTSGDVDILITFNNGKNRLSSLIEMLTEIKLLKHIISLGDVKFAGTYFSTYPTERPGILRKIDIRYVPVDHFPTALLHSTGSDALNIEMRNRAIDLGLMLSEHGVSRNGIYRFPVRKEEDVFNILGIKYIPPEQRNKDGYTLVPLTMEDVEGIEDPEDEFEIVALPTDKDYDPLQLSIDMGTTIGEIRSTLEEYHHLPIGIITINGNRVDDRLLVIDTLLPIVKWLSFTVVDRKLISQR